MTNRKTPVGTKWWGQTEGNKLTVTKCIMSWISICWVISWIVFSPLFFISALLLTEYCTIVWFLIKPCKSYATIYLHVCPTSYNTCSNKQKAWWHGAIAITWSSKSAKLMSWLWSMLLDIEKKSFKIFGSCDTLLQQNSTKHSKQSAKLQGRHLRLVISVGHSM